jgi:hypothetical protein
MTLFWLRIVTGAVAHPLVVVACVTALGASAWLAHIWHLRRRERDLLLVVDERTRQWQAEVQSHAKLQRQVTTLSEMADRLLWQAVTATRSWADAASGAGPAADAPREISPASDARPDAADSGHRPASAAGRSPVATSSRRILIVEERQERRVDLQAALDGLAVTPVFADSAWAASVAVAEARSVGAPYELVLVGDGIDPVDSDAVPLPQDVDRAAMTALISSSLGRPEPRTAAPSAAR